MRNSVFIFIIVSALLECCNSSGGIDPQSYEEKVMSIKEMECASPTSFLTADGTYNTNFWGDKFKVHGKIKNAATAATYKDVVVKVRYYSKTKTELANKLYTIYDFFPPNSEKYFELKIDNYSDVSTIGWDVISATPSE